MNYSNKIHNVFQSAKKAIARDVLRDQAGQFRSAKMSLPSFSEVVENSKALRSVKGQESVISTLKQGVRDALLASLQQHGISTHHGAVPERLSTTFRNNLEEMFSSYTGGPSSSKLNQIAVTETKSLANRLRFEYVSNVQRANPGRILMKEWRHTSALKAHDARPNHLAMHGVSVPVHTPFKLRTKHGIIMCSGPHDDSLPVGEIVECHCSLKFYVKKGSMDD